MKRNNLLFILFLTGCDGISFGLLGDSGHPTKTNATDPRYLPGVGFQCTADDQCGDGGGIICYKENDSYVGVCSKVSY